MKHAPTLKDVRLDRFRKLSRVAVEELFHTAPNTRLFDFRLGEPVVIEELRLA